MQSIRKTSKQPRRAACSGLLPMLALLLLIFVLIGLFRILGTLMPVELAYLLVGGIFLLVGVFLWRQRRPSVKDEA